MRSLVGSAERAVSLAKQGMRNVASWIHRERLLEILLGHHQVPFFQKHLAEQDERNRRSRFKENSLIERFLRLQVFARTDVGVSEPVVYFAEKRI